MVYLPFWALSILQGERYLPGVPLFRNAQKNKVARLRTFNMEYFVGPGESGIKSFFILPFQLNHD